MITNLNVLSDKKIDSTTDTIKMRLNENAAAMVFQMFTKNIYSNPIGTVVREITSNCFDSHVEAGIKAPVLIKKSFDDQTNTHYISFIDYGVGMSPDRVKNVYAVYFESTKRCDNTQIGGFGIGAKSVLAYKRPTGYGTGEYDNSFYVITVYNGVKYYYCIVEGTDSPEISLLHEEETTEHNGTEVRIPVLEKDLDTFAKEMVRQLYYFEDIIFEGFENTRYGDTLLNEYQIIHGKTFLYRGTEYSSTMHVCLGRVAYPIDYDVLGLNSRNYYIPVAVKLEVGEINVTASREQLDYSEHTIKVLKKKLDEVKAEITQLLIKQYENIVTLRDYFQFENEFGELRFPNGITLPVTSLINQNDVDLSNFKYSFMKMPDDKQLFSFFFESKKYGKKTENKSFNGSYNTLKHSSNLLYIEGEFQRKVAKQSYLKEKFSTYYIINRRKIDAGYMRSEIAELFNTHLDKLVDDNGKPVEFVQFLIEMQEEYWQIVIENAKNYDTIEVPAEFTVRKKRNVLNDELRNTTVPVKLFGSYGKERIKFDVLFKFPQPIFYGIQEDESKLNTAYELFRNLFDKKLIVSRYRNHDDRLEWDGKKGIMFIMLSKSNVKYMQFCKKAYHVDEFYNRMLYRKADLVTKYFQIYGLIERYNTLGSLYKTKNFNVLNAKWGAVINEVNKFIETLPKINSNISSLKTDLSRFFDLTNIKLTPEQKKYAEKIEELHKLEYQNRNILSYFRTYYIDNELSDVILVDILKKVMVFWPYIINKSKYT